MLWELTYYKLHTHNAVIHFCHVAFVTMLVDSKTLDIKRSAGHVLLSTPATTTKNNGEFVRIWRGKVTDQADLTKIVLGHNSSTLHGEITKQY